MCHPGYPSVDVGDEFSKSSYRKHEMELLKSKEFDYLIAKFNKISFRQISF